LGGNQPRFPPYRAPRRSPKVSWRSATGLRAPVSRPALSCSRNCYLLGGVGYGLLGAAAGNAGRPTYRRRRDRNVDRNHHRVHAGVRVGVSRGAGGREGWLARSCRGGAGGLRGESKGGTRRLAEPRRQTGEDSCGRDRATCPHRMASTNLQRVSANEQDCCIVLLPRSDIRSWSQTDRKHPLQVARRHSINQIHQIQTSQFTTRAT